MELDIGEVLKGVPPLVDQAANDQGDFERLVAVMTQMQEGINQLTEIVVKQRAEIEALKVETRRLKARTDAPARPTIIHSGDMRWPN